MNIHNLSKEAALKSLVTSEQGLSGEEAAKRLREYGANEIREVRKKPLYRKFIAQFTHFLAVLLWMAASLCFLSEYLHPGEGLFSLGVAVVGVIWINAIFTFVQEYRAEKAIEALKKLLPFDVKVLRAGAITEVLAEKIVPGDILLLSEGDRVPADARVLESNFLMVNNAPLTGESEMKPRNHGAFEGDHFESPNIVFAGTHITSGSGRAVAYATGMSTEFGKIAHLAGGVQERMSPLQKEIVKVTRVIAVIALSTGIFFFALGTFIGRSFWHNLLFAIGITIANVPEGLLPTVTLSLAMGSQRMAKKKALIKTLTAVETLGAVTVICTDKTGTLTQNKMEVQRIWTASDSDALRIPSPLTGEGKGGGETWSGISPSPSSPPVKGGETSKNMLMKTAYLCNNATYHNGIYKGDPTETAILKKAREALGDMRSERVFELPFDSERKRMTTVCKAWGKGQGAKGPSDKAMPALEPSDPQTLRPFSFVSFTKGALETVLPLCSSILAEGDVRPVSDDDRKTIMQVYHSMMDEGLRVIAFAYKEINDNDVGKGVLQYAPADLESNLIFAGLMGLEDPPRPEVPDAIGKCNEAGIRVIMMTGDAGRTAAAIARQIGLAKNKPTVIEGPEINVMPDSELRKMLLSGEIIFARMTPAHKMRIVTILEDEGERVAVTGDGVNDAPALKKANIGIAMGLSGTDVAKEAADVVLLDDNFATIVNAVEEGRAIFENIKKFITYIFAHGTPEAVPYILFAFMKIPLPLTVMQILAIDLGTETIPALALGVEAPEADIMKNPPRPPDKGLIDRSVLFRGYIFIGLISAAGVLLGYFFTLFHGGWKWGMDLPADHLLARQAATATFLGIVIVQIGNVFACRSSKDSIFKLGFFSNKLVIIGIIAEILLAAFIIYHPLGNRIFGTAPLGIHVWLLLVPCSIVLLLAEELRKWLSGRKTQ